MKTKDEPLNGYQVQELMNDMNERLNLMVDEEITPNMTIEQIFKDRGHVFLFHPWKGQEIGHFVCMVRHKDEQTGKMIYYYFDSFGKRPYNKAIDKVILKAGHNLYYNDVEFQPESSNACGKYCLLVIALNKLGLNPAQIETFLKSHGKDLNKFILETVK